MFPDIQLTQETYSRLADHAEGFETPDAVIKRLLDKIEEATDGTSEERQAKPTDARDYTVYEFNGGTYGKGRLALAIVAAYATDREKLTFEDLHVVFPKSLQGSLGVFTTIEDALEIAATTSGKRHFIKQNEIVELEDCTIAVCTQWGKANIGNLLKAAQKLGLEISERNESKQQIHSEKTAKKPRTLRGIVIKSWEEEGKKRWSVEDTLDACIAADADLARRKLNPAPRFRQELADNNDEYVRNWVLGCRFGWL